MRVAPLLLCIVLFSSCQKILEYFDNTPTETNSGCRVFKWTTKYDEGQNYNTVFRYHPNGNPSEILYSSPDDPDYFQHEWFSYDSLNRLKAHFIDYYGVTTKKYYYEGDARTPYKDTMTDAEGRKFVELFESDSKERITRWDLFWISSPPEFEEDWSWYKEFHRYFYDIHGNRQVNPLDHPWHKIIKYTEDPSLYSLHPVWQLIHRDYSKNSVPVGKTFNDRKLPQTFKVSDENTYWQPFFDLEYLSRIQYFCN
jgi:hypothetical protein